MDAATISRLAAELHTGHYSVEGAAMYRSVIVGAIVGGAILYFLAPMLGGNPLIFAVLGGVGGGSVSYLFQHET